MQLILVYSYFYHPIDILNDFAKNITLFLKKIAIEHISVVLRIFIYNINMEIRRAKKDDCYEIKLNSWPNNEPAIKFYVKMGMKTRSVVLEYILEDDNS